MGVLQFTPNEIEAYYRVRVPKLRQEGEEWRGPCPIHRGENDSFSVKSTTGEAFCHSKCGHGWHIVGLEMALTSKDWNAARKEVFEIIGRNGAALQRIVAQYDYTDEAGILLFQVVRYYPKTFKQRRPDGHDGWVWNVRDVLRVLYRLPEVVKAKIVVLVEGEKDADTARTLGFTGTTNPGGAKKWHQNYTNSLKGKEVIVIPDRDEKGRSHAEFVAADLARAGIRYRVVQLPNGKDLTEWKELGGTAERLNELITATPVGGGRNATTPGNVATIIKDPPKYLGEPYCFHAGGIWGFRCSGDHRLPIQITNFEARIECDRTVDDGTEDETRWFTVKAAISGRSSDIDVSAKEFRSMNWVPEKLGGMAIVYPGKGEDARAAIQFLSGEIPIVRGFSHTGWRNIDGRPHYLHARGAIGADGNRADVQVSLEGILPNYSLPDPPSGEMLVNAIRSSLGVLDIAPDPITFPVLAGAYRAPLGDCAISVHIEGTSGQGKTQLAALAQQHYGVRMDAEHLPASWDDTGLASATLAFHAKDAVLVVDDFVLSGNAARQQKLHAEADRLLRSQANTSGRRRVSTEGKLRSSHPPRGLIISTGEHTPIGKSLNARMVIVPFPKGAMNWSKLTKCQEAAAQGSFAAAMAAYIRWIASRRFVLRQEMEDLRLGQRKIGNRPFPHMRTPENLSSLFFGLQTFLRFARESNAIYREELRTYEERLEGALREVAKNESGKHSINDPPRIFLRMVKTAVTMGRAHLASPNGGAPDGEVPWGWQTNSANGLRSPQGARIGWVKKSEVCLDPDASFQIASKLAQERGEALPGSLDAIKRNLKEEGYIKTDEKRRTITVRRTFEREPHDVLCFTLEKFQSASLEYADNADNTDNSLPNKEDGEI